MNDYYNNFQLTTGMHAGTHIDGPMHLLDSPKYLCDVPLDTFVGKGSLLNVYQDRIIDRKPHFENMIGENEIVLLYTGHSEVFGREEYFSDYPVMTMELAQLLVEKKTKIVGMDTPSPDTFPFEIHKFLLQNNVLILENVTNLHMLANVDNFEVMALPLHIQADSSICRVIARTILG